MCCRLLQGDVGVHSAGLFITAVVCYELTALSCISLQNTPSRLRRGEWFYVPAPVVVVIIIYYYYICI